MQRLEYETRHNSKFLAISEPRTIHKQKDSQWKSLSPEEDAVPEVVSPYAVLIQRATAVFCIGLQHLLSANMFPSPLMSLLGSYSECVHQRLRPLHPLA
jgi:hypothetical protein